MVNPNRFYTYAYLREDRTPYYIGKGKGRRLYNKGVSEVGKPKVKDKIIFLKQNLTEEEAFKHEIYMIVVLGRKDLGTGILRNRTNGGDGVSGRIASGKKNNFYGKKHTLETKQKIAEKSKNRIITQETREKLRLANKGKNVSQETREKLRLANKRKIVSQETREKLRLAGVSQRPEVRKKISEANSGEKNGMYGKHHTEETKQKISEINKNRVLKPFTEEHKRKISEANKGRKMTEEQIQKRLKSISGKYKGKNNKNTKKHYLTFNDGSTIIIDNGITEWCKQNNYSVSGLYKVKCGKNTNYKGIIEFKTL